MTEQVTVAVALPDGRAYPVLVGDGVRHELAALVPDRGPPGGGGHPGGHPGVEVDPGVEHRVFTIGDGEAHKTIATVERAVLGSSRGGASPGPTAWSAVGGGLVTDVAGFAASVYHRGIPVVHVATTLLAQIDAAIGGKTGVNLPEGKNLVGTYWQPSAVLCDTGDPGHPAAPRVALRPRRAGQVPLAGWRPPRRAAPGRARGRAACASRPRWWPPTSAKSGRRALLNYGHTLAHALEIAGDHDLRHGEAVAIGLVYAAELARLAGPDRRRRGGRAPSRGGRLRPADATCPAGLDDDELRRADGPRQEGARPRASPSCWTAPTGWRWCPGVDPAGRDGRLEAVR